MYHGTSLVNAQSILRSRVLYPSDGQLGRGVYLAEYDKAERFARDAESRGKGNTAF
jgi:hypothetical protein